MNETDRLRCKEIVREAGLRLMQMRDMRIEEKTDFKNLVTSCDKDTQTFLVEELQKVDPEATFLCEENDVCDTTGSHFFVIDPIDGTSNFIHDMKLSCICVAYADHEQVLWGMVYNPYMDEFFEGTLGEGAHLNGQKIQVRREPLAHCLAAFGTSPYYKEYKEETFALGCLIQDHCLDLRRTGSAEIDLCYAACGRIGLFFERVLSPWDFAAGMCIVKEAGGIVRNFEGQAPDYTRKSSVAAGSRENVEQFLSLYREFKEER